MTEKHTDHTPDKVNTDITSVLGAGFNEQDALAVGVEGTASGFKGTSTRSAGVAGVPARGSFIP